MGVVWEGHEEAWLLICTKLILTKRIAFKSEQVTASHLEARGGFEMAVHCLRTTCALHVGHSISWVLMVQCTDCVRCQHAHVMTWAHFLHPLHSSLGRPQVSTLRPQVYPES